MNIDKQALREVAEKATKGPWTLFSDIDTKTFSIHTPRDKRCENVIKWGGFDCQPNAEANAEFIAAFNPKVALALLDENIQLQREKDAIEAVALALRDDMRQAREKLEAAERSIAELERSETQLINERDYAESALNDAYKAVMGQAPEWSNWFSFENAIDEIELVCELWRNQTDDVIQFRQRIQELEARQIALPQRLSPEGYHIDEAYMVDDDEGEYLDRDAVIEAIRAAGIKVEGE
ncbi:ead/Ea22-like family protein [Salmonella enterica subsp. enterica]|nr:ead/Ea22-like family protein [Salmonella enterica]EBF6639555.1 ead/Ea22-like family protein [Salmonella enterica subsp. enterica serovar Reading]EDV4520642.1 ead/Ea22-like family protein [Salmonella enterica subsp. enterica]EDV5307165.1 ead/Ea22-like family protein [Salmonella enterica subsp. enterica]